MTTGTWYFLTTIFGQGRPSFSYLEYFLLNAPANSGRSVRGHSPPPLFPAFDSYRGWFGSALPYLAINALGAFRRSTAGVPFRRTVGAVNQQS